MELKLSKILVPIDFSELSMDALDYASVIANELNGELVLLHVIESYQYNSSFRPDVTSEDIISKGVEIKLQEIAREHGVGSNVNLTTLNKAGKIYKTITEVVEEEEIDLVIMGTHGATGIGSFGTYVLGTNAYRVVQLCKCPVITLRQKIHDGMFEKILLPLDLTKDTTQKVDVAIEIAKMFGADIHVLAVSTFLDEFTEHVPRLQREMTVVVNKIRQEGVDCHSMVESNENPAHAILAYTEKHDIDLIVIMTKQEKSWNEIFVGSSAKRVISASPVPVLSLKPQEA